MKESDLLNTVCNYLKFHYPNVIYRVDFAAGMKLTIGQAVRQKKLQHGRAYPDLFIANCKGNYGGLFIELKREGEKITNGKGHFVSPHVAEQSAQLFKLRLAGYMAEFAIGFKEAKELIDKYLK